MQAIDKSVYSPWALLRGEEIFWLGMVKDEDEAWQIALGWPDKEEINDAKARGIRAIQVSLTPQCYTIA